MSAGGIYYAGNTIEGRQVTDIGHQAGRYCIECADIVAFWLVIDGDDDTGGECEGCGVTVMAADACYCMAAISCPACFLATFDTDPTTTTPKEGAI
jgi:hypothetical protein